MGELTGRYSVHDTNGTRSACPANARVQKTLLPPIFDPLRLFSTPPPPSPRPTTARNPYPTSAIHSSSRPPSSIQRSALSHPVSIIAKLHSINDKSLDSANSSSLFRQVVVALKSADFPARYRQDEQSAPSAGI